MSFLFFVLGGKVLALLQVEQDRLIIFPEGFLDTLIRSVLIFLVLNPRLVSDVRAHFGGGLLFVKDFAAAFLIVHHLFVLDKSHVLVFQILIEPVFDLTDGASKQGFHLGDLAPLRPNLVVHHEDEGVFLRGPLPSNDGGVDDVVPPLAALAAEASGEESGNDDPVLGAVLLDLGPEDPVLLLGPLGAGADVLGGGQTELRVVFLLEEEPPLEATDLRLVRHELAQPVPRLVPVDLHQPLQL
jgi:hypothetical protein